MRAVRELSEEPNLTVSTDDLQLFDTAFVRHPTGHHVLLVMYVAPRAATTGTVAPRSDTAAAQFWTLPELAASDEAIEPGYEPIFTAAVNEFTTA